MIALTDNARNKAVELVQREGRDDLVLRVAVQPGGCSGLRYQLFFDTRELEGDERLDLESEAGELAVVVDRMSLPYLSRAVVDYRDSIEAQGFTIDNPDAGGSCACGDSFH